MPPVLTWVAGCAANEGFYRLMFGSIVPGQFGHLRIGADGQPAPAFYRPTSPGAPHTLAAIQLVATRDGATATVDHLMLAEVYPLFGVPRQLPAN
jgi:hypothetical protein